jgi:hypothetical protein
MLLKNVVDLHHFDADLHPACHFHSGPRYIKLIQQLIYILQTLHGTNVSF